MQRSIKEYYRAKRRNIVVEMIEIVPAVLRIQKQEAGKAKGERQSETQFSDIGREAGSWHQASTSQCKRLAREIGGPDFSK